MGNRTSTSKHAVDRKQAVQKASEQVEHARRTSPPNHQSLTLFDNDRDIIADIALTQLAREGLEFNKNDLVAILAKLLNVNNSNGLRDLFTYSMVDLRTAVRVAVFTPTVTAPPAPSTQSTQSTQSILPVTQTPIQYDSPVDDVVGSVHTPDLE